MAHKKHHHRIFCIYKNWKIKQSSIAKCCRLELHIFTYCLNSFSSPSIVAWSPSPVMIRMHPFFAKLRAIPSPIPLVEPVTKATFPVKSITGKHCSIVIFQSHTYGHSIQYLGSTLNKILDNLSMLSISLFLKHTNIVLTISMSATNRFYYIFKYRSFKLSKKDHNHYQYKHNFNENIKTIKSFT